MSGAFWCCRRTAPWRRTARSMKGRYAKGKILLRRTSRAEGSGRADVLGVGLGQPDVERRDHAGLLSRRSGGAVGLQVLADMLDGGGRLPVRVGRSAEDMGEQPRAQEGVRYHLLDDGQRARAPHREQGPCPDEVG